MNGEEQHGQMAKEGKNGPWLLNNNREESPELKVNFFSLIQSGM